MYALDFFSMLPSSSARNSGLADHIRWYASDSILLIILGGINIKNNQKRIELSTRTVSLVAAGYA